jgi:RNA polymerase sigma factor (sigma-70 family)
MPEPDDIVLLRQYAGGDEGAFTALFERHVHLVYSAALRQVRIRSHAEEITQAVFILLARKAKSLNPKTVLSGWLYQAARLTAASLIKREIRRQRREQEVYMQNPTEAATPLWEQIAPLLDEAMGQLGEQDRNAIVLRYFENRTPQEVAVALKLNEVAARKRVSRALEKLRNVFAKRGVFSTGAIIGGVISANSVQAAPAAFANSAAAITIAKGAAVSASTLTLIKGATKAIAMTTFQKTIVTAVLAATVGAGIFEAHQKSESQKQIQNLQQQQNSMNEQLAQLQRDRDDATNRLAGLLAENAQLKSGSNENELLKLRGQVGLLQRQLTFVQAKINLPSSGLEKLMADPAMKEMVDQQARRVIKLRYAEMFRELKLSPEQIEKFALIYANSAAAPAGTDVDGQLRSLLSEEGYARFQEYTQEVPARTTVELLNSQLGASQLTDEQNAQLLQLVKAEPYNLTYGIEGDLNPAFFGTQDQIDNYVQQAADSNQRVVQQAAAFLTHDQLAALNAVLTNALSARVVQAAALTQKH